MLYRRSSLPLVLIVCLCLTSCSSLAPSPTPTQTQPPTKTPTPSPTATKSPVPSPTITPTPEPSPTLSCDPDEVLAKLKSYVPYDEFTLHHNSIDGIPSLVIWYVEPWIELPIDEETIVAQSLIVMYQALRTSATLNRVNKCVGVLFEFIKPIVVDSDYNGWFAGAVKVSDLPSSPHASVEDLKPAQESLVVAYQRQVPPSPISGQPGPEGTCNWPEAKARIRWHFSSELQNVSFYFVIDEVGVNVWANWVGYGDPLELEFASLLNIAMELQCLHPPLDWLWVIVVHDNGAPKLIGRVPGEAVYADDFMEGVINQFQVFYP